MTSNEFICFWLSSAFESSLAPWELILFKEKESTMVAFRAHQALTGRYTVIDILDILTGNKPQGSNATIIQSVSFRIDVTTLKSNFQL
jgi:hypothetical protein